MREKVGKIERRLQVFVDFFQLPVQGCQRDTQGLGGFPGVYSAYVFKTLGCKGLLKLLEGRENRQAEFRCCAGHIDRGRSVIVTGRVQGLIIGEMRGSGGFGYDPIFVPAGEDRTFAEMSVAEKNALSHRGKAFDLLIREIKTLER